jgi:hypothetical protein
MTSNKISYNINHRDNFVKNSKKFDKIPENKSLERAYKTSEKALYTHQKMSLCRQQSCAVGPSFEDKLKENEDDMRARAWEALEMAKDMAADLVDLKLHQLETKEMAQDISGDLDGLTAALVQENKKLKDENAELKRKLMQIQEACVGDGLEYLLEEK